MSRLFCIACACLLVTACSDQPANVTTPAETTTVWFTDVAKDAGLTTGHWSGANGAYLMPEIMGGGVALADVDGDGDLDLYLVQGGGTLSGSDHDAANILYLNRGDGTFEPAPSSHGAGDRGYGMGVAAADYDNDGDVDLYVTNVGPNTLLRNDGSGRFEDVTADAGVGDGGWGTAAAFTDLDADGHLDLVVVNYIAWSARVEKTCYANGVRAYCAPSDYDAPAVDLVYRNAGDGTFTNETQAAGLHFALGNGLGLAVADFDGDGRRDLFVANDMMTNQYWNNRGGFRFTNEAMSRGVAVDENGAVKAGMGVAAADVDADGDTDLLVVNLETQTDTLFLNEIHHFRDATAALGLNALSRRHTRFGVAFADFDNDGQLDVYEANGRILPGTPNAEGDIYAETNTLFRGSGGRFVAATPQGGTAEALVQTSRGLAVGDLDDDGGLDVVVVNRDAPPFLLHNTVPNRGGWIRFRVLNRWGSDAVDASVSARAGKRTLQANVQPSGSYLVSHDPRVHFGLGTTDEVEDVRVTWGDGTTEAFGSFTTGQTVALWQGEGR